MGRSETHVHMWLDESAMKQYMRNNPDFRHEVVGIMREEQHVGSRADGPGALTEVNYSGKIVLFHNEGKQSMKKFLLALSLISLLGGAHAQGLISLDNYDNSNTSWTATNGGLFWLNIASGNSVTLGLINTNFNVNFYGGSDANSMVLLSPSLIPVAVQCTAQERSSMCLANRLQFQAH